MFAVVLTLLLLVALAVAVLGAVAVPALRAGREVLTERGAATVEQLRERRDPHRALPPAPEEPAERESVPA